MESTPTTPENLKVVPSVFTTPETNHNYDIQTTNSVKENVRLVSPNGGFCLVTNASYPIRHCHCLPRKFMKDGTILAKLEWYWNMKKTTLNLDSRYNIFCADPNLHCAFDENKWLLLPEESIVKQFRDACLPIKNRRQFQRNLFPVFPEKQVFFYTFVHLQGMEDVVIPRRDEVGSNTWTLHKHPFNTLPPLGSHLHPKFVIFNCGRKLPTLLSPLYDKIMKDFPIFDDIEFVYRAWAAPPEYTDDPTYNAPVVNDGDDYYDGYDYIDDPKDQDYFEPARASQKEVSARQLPKRIVTKRRNPSPTRNRKALSEVISNTFYNPLLSEVGLSSHNRQIGETRWTADRIRQWADPLPKRRKLDSS